MLKKELPNEKTRPVLEKILESISAGFENNTSCDQEVLFDLIYLFLHDEGIGNDSMAVGFALDLLLKILKKSKLEELKQEEFFPLPSLTPEGDKYEGDRLLTKVLSIAKPGSNITLTVLLSFFQLLSWFIRSNKMKTEQLTEVMKLPEFEDIESDQHYRALLLFEAMVEGRSMDTEIHEIANDDEDPKTPLHGSQSVVPKATPVLTDGPKSANVCRDTSTKAKISARSTESRGVKKVPLRKHCEDTSRVLSDNVENSTNSLPVVKVISELPAKDVKQILQSPMKSPQLVSPNKQVAGQHKTAKPPVKVSDAKKPHSESGKESVVGSDKVSPSQSQPANQRHRPASVGDKPTVVSKAALRLSDADVSKDTSGDLSAVMVGYNRENGSAPFTRARTPDSAASMKDLIAAAQAKRKVAHSQNSVFGNLNSSLLSISDTQMRSHSPFMVQNASASAAIVMPVAVQGHQQDSFPSNHEHQSSSRNQNETDDNEERRLSSGHESVGGSLSGGTDAAVSRDAFEGMVETLSRTKESIGRATRLAIDCAKYGIASELATQTTLAEKFVCLYLGGGTSHTKVGK
ncbi:hypothetical protein F2Q70_00018800 [Brassica cretica]|uniref:Uncharacterized protein n=1 Tax=Brassica cretica TaxID=69181 RepID=A0A8S9HRM9_BRACR|nr:hypothetical protein F2Q70_00018800 [Brassica cretica]